MFIYHGLRAKTMYVLVLCDGTEPTIFIIVIIIKQVRLVWHKLMIQDHLTKVSETRAVRSQQLMVN